MFKFYESKSHEVGCTSLSREEFSFWFTEKLHLSLRWKACDDGRTPYYCIDLSWYGNHRRIWPKTIFEFVYNPIGDLFSGPPHIGVSLFKWFKSIDL